MEVPAASVRTPAQQLETFRLAEGFRAELFASEPLIGDPVAAAFDAAARLWVVEMRGFMNDVDGKDEREPSGRIVVLEDRDGDGRADASTVFVDGLVLPRAVLPLRGGALVIAPPNLLWCPDENGDLRADRTEVLSGGFEAGLDNPEHAGNGLVWGLDHRIHIANDRRLVRWTPRGFVVEDGAGGGQWGLSHDDRGRFYFNYNEDWLRCDLVPGRYGPHAAPIGGLALHNHRVCADNSVWPIHRTPGVNRGYQPGRLVDYVLAIRTAVCAPYVYRGTLLPGCDGNVFVCEPAGNVVRRLVLEDQDGLQRGRNPYEAERREFFASTDERCRPVNLLSGPDGALYVVDMYRGVIQHKNFVTTFLRRQILGRGLEQPIGLGRIWRIVPEGGGTMAAAPSLLDAPIEALVDALASDAGAARDIALHELVQRQERRASDRLRERLREHARPACRIVLLSALHGLGTLSATDLRYALRDADTGVVTMALQLAAPFLALGDGHLWLQCEARLTAGPAAVRWQLALTFGDVLAAVPDGKYRERSFENLARLALVTPDDANLRSAVAAAAHPHTMSLLDELERVAKGIDSAALRIVQRDLARAAVKSRDPALQMRLFDGMTSRPAVAQLALLRGAVDALPKGEARAGWLRFPATPLALQQLAQSPDAAVVRLASELLAAMELSGDRSAAMADVELDPGERQRVAAGERLFARVCAACHQLDGNGLAGLAPPLRDSEWVLGASDRLLRIVLHGMRGPIEVNGTRWELEMPGQRQLGDSELASVASYLRRAFGHRGAVVAPAEVAAVRAAHKARGEPWTAEELLGTK
ncbi:MAG: c-type cytochrome [Planctomycetota bacterium]